MFEFRPWCRHSFVILLSVRIWAVRFSSVKKAKKRNQAVSGTARRLGRLGKERKEKTRNKLRFISYGRAKDTGLYSRECTVRLGSCVMAAQLEPSGIFKTTANGNLRTRFLFANAGHPAYLLRWSLKSCVTVSLKRPFVRTNVVHSALFASPMPFQSRLIVCYGRPINFDMLLTSAARAVCLTSPVDLFTGVFAQFPNSREFKRSSVLILKFSRYITPLEYRRFETLHRQFSTSRYPVTKPPAGTWNLCRGMSCHSGVRVRTGSLTPKSLKDPVHLSCTLVGIPNVLQ